MAKTVHEIMNRELFSLRPHDAVTDAMGYLLALGVTGAPVVDAEGIPLGVISVRDLIRTRGGSTVAERMGHPAVSVTPDSMVRDAARIMAEHGIHRLPVVDGAGRAIGMLSMIDVLRALLGVPVSHPDTFPHFDSETGLCWTDDTPLDIEHADRAPDGPGILVLRLGGRNLAECDVWVEASNNVRARVHDLSSLPQPNRALTALLQRFPNDLSFRAAAVSLSPERDEVVNKVRARIETWTRSAE
jgi:CBS domain-containing protein